jgi:hypothetical protein
MALQILARAPFAIVLSNPSLHDDPLVYVNDAFERATGYSRRPRSAATAASCRGPRPIPPRSAGSARPCARGRR